MLTRSACFTAAFLFQVLQIRTGSKEQLRHIQCILPVSYLGVIQHVYNGGSLLSVSSFFAYIVQES